METDGHPVVFAEIGEGPRTLLSYGHYDVQPPEPLDLWESDPFEPTVRDGGLYARGVADDKADVLSRIQALPNSAGEYHRPPMRNVDRAATRTAQEIDSTRMMAP